MCLTLLACMWALTRLDTRRVPVVAAPVDSARGVIPEPRPLPEDTTRVPPVDITQLPLVAMENTCYYPGGEDLSGCTGTISGGPVREYTLHTTGHNSYYISAEPRSLYFDLSLAIYDVSHACVVGKDDRGPGYSESALLENPAQGDYRLVVGGYGEDCGPYELSVSAKAPEIAQVMKPATLVGRNGTVVRWETFAEVDLAHFELYRQTKDQREQIAVLRAHGSKAGFANYRFTDRSPRTDSVYVIEAVAKDGRRQVVVI